MDNFNNCLHSNGMLCKLYGCVFVFIDLACNKITDTGL
jgi:hypothetical protein